MKHLPIDACATLQELFAASGRWTKLSLAEDVNGWPVEPEDESACRFCITGGALRIYPEAEKRLILWKLREAAAADLGMDGQYSIATWNDMQGRTIKDVRRLVKMAGV